MSTPATGLLIAGGGAAGMVAALAARAAARLRRLPDHRFPVVILERNAAPGAKIAISGGGRCNLTHDGSPAELLEKGFLSREEQRFLRHAFHAFTGTDLLGLLGRYGLQCAARPDGKFFPEAGKGAPDVVQAFIRMLRDSAVTLVTSCTISEVACSDGVFRVGAGDRTFTGAALILATGGVSWPSTGSTGDGLRFARKLGHTITKPSPALAPLFTVVKPPAELAGVSLRSVALIASAPGRQASRKGDILFTHRGLSGPAVLSLSRDIAMLLKECETCALYADLFADLSQEATGEMLLSEARRNGSRLVRSFLSHCSGAFPASLAPFIMTGAGIPDGQRLSGLSRAQRVALQTVLKRFPLGSVKAVPLEQGEVSAGGVPLCDVNPKTMESRLVPGLFFAGEILDYTGEIGGFNLQAAFSTGWLAGQEAAGRRQEPECRRP